MEGDDEQTEAFALKFLVSRHAQQEILRRQIPRELLESLLENPQQRVPQPGGMQILQSRLEFEDGRMYLLRAVVAIDKEPPVVVTAYRTTKIEKYWRPE